MSPVVSGPSLGMALLALGIAVAFVRHRAGLGLITGAVLLVWAIRWFIAAPLEQLGPLTVGVDGVGLTAALGAVAGCALGRGRARAGIAVSLLAAALMADLRFGVSALAIAWGGAAAVHAGPKRLMIGSLFVGTVVVGAWWLGAGRLDALPPLRGVVQLRILGVYAAAVIPALLLPGAARMAGLLAWTFGLVRFVAPLCPEAVALVGPGLRWLALGVATLGAALMVLRRPIPPIGLIACAGAWMGLATGTALGVGGAALLLAAGALGLPLVQRDPRIGGLLAFASPATVAGLLWVVHATGTAVGPVSFAGWTLGIAAAAAVALVGAALAPRAPLVGGRGLALGITLGAALGLGPLLGRPLPGAEEIAAQVGRRGIPPDDRFGWRRVQWLEGFRPQPADAGVD